MRKLTWVVAVLLVIVVLGLAVGQWLAAQASAA
jgi:hypothetical protein